MLSSGNLGVGIGLDVLWRLNAAAVDYATTWSFAAYAQANGGALPGPWANVRRTGTATYENASGVITTLPDLGGGTYAARVNYRSGTARGLLIEGQAPQLSGYTGAFDNAAWGKSGGASITANAVAGPGGSTTADLLTATGATSILYQTFAGAGTYSLQIKFKANATQQVCIDMSLGGNGRIATFNTNGSASVAAKGTGVGASGGTASVVAVAGGWYLAKLEGLVTSTGLYAIVSLPAAGSVYIDEWQLEAGSVCTSYMPNASSGSVVRAADSAGVFLTSTALSSAFPGGVGQPWTTVFQYIKPNSVASNETLFALSAGSSAGSTNLLALQVNGTQAQAVHSGGSGTLSGTLVHDGSTVNKIALSVDPVSGKVSVSVNGAAAVETTGIAFTGVDADYLIPGARTITGDTSVKSMEIADWRNVNTAYTTGSALQALSA